MTHPHKQAGKILNSIKPGKKLDRGKYFEKETILTDFCKKFKQQDNNISLTEKEFWKLIN
jgi:hypothetical protein